MKYKLNKANLAKIPGPIRKMVEGWRLLYRKSTISVERCTKVYVQEDARYTAFSLDLSVSQTERAAGEWAGLTRLSPTAEIALPPGCTLVATGFFCGVPWLTLYHNDSPDLAGLLEPAKVLNP